METEIKKPFTRSADTGLLVTLLGETAEGEICSYTAMNLLLGRDIRGNRSSLHSALRIIEVEGAVFEAVPNRGYRRLPPADTVRSVDGLRGRQHRIARKAMKRLATVQTDKLDDAGRQRYYTHLSIQGAMEAATRAQAVKRIESAVNGSSHQLAIAATLEALKG